MSATWTHVFDLDGTLYPIENGYERACRRRVFEYMASGACPGITDEVQAKEIWSEAFAKYNQTLRSLRAIGYDGFDEEEYWAYTRGDPRTHLREDGETRAMVEALRGKKVVFTNCHEKQAREALEALGLSDCFDGVFGAGGMGNVCKPEEEAFRKLFAAHGIEDPTKCVFYEDSLKNLRAASALGMVTVLVAGETLEEELRAGNVDVNVDLGFVDVIVHGGRLNAASIAAASPFASRARAPLRVLLGKDADDTTAAEE